jgi:EpsI family protein
MDQVRSIRIAILLIFLSALVAYTYILRYREVAPPLPPDLSGIPAGMGDYASTDEYQPAEALRLLGADATVFRSYRNSEGHTVQFFLGYFGTQQENSQIHSPKHCYPGAGWDIVREGSVRLRLPGSEVPVKDLIISDGRDVQEVVYWFDTRSGVITDEFVLKWYQMKSALLRKPQAAAFIRFSTEISPDSPERSREELIRFIESITPLITASLREHAAGTDRRS